MRGYESLTIEGPSAALNTVVRTKRQEAGVGGPSGLRDEHDEHGEEIPRVSNQLSLLTLANK